MDSFMVIPRLAEAMIVAADINGTALVSFRRDGAVSRRWSAAAIRAYHSAHTERRRTPAGHRGAAGWTGT
jgi:hypothetical protein